MIIINSKSISPGINHQESSLYAKIIDSFLGPKAHESKPNLFRNFYTLTTISIIQAIGGVAGQTFYMRPEHINDQHAPLIAGISAVAIALTALTGAASLKRADAMEKDKEYLKLLFKDPMLFIKAGKTSKNFSPSNPYQIGLENLFIKDNGPQVDISAQKEQLPTTQNK